MTKQMITIHNAETGEIATREFTPEEYAQQVKDKANSLAFKQEMKDKENAKQSAQAKLAALGLTADEIAALGN
jgi:hypothetical protein